MNDTRRQYLKSGLYARMGTAILPASCTTNSVQEMDNVTTDWYKNWEVVTDAPDVPVTSGDGELSLRNFRWPIGNGAAQMVQQDLFYFGGMIRCMRVTCRAATKGNTCTPNISGTGLGYSYMMQLVRAIPKAGAYQEFKGIGPEVPLERKTSSLQPEDGILHLPKGTGSGVEIDPGFIAKHSVMRL